MSLKLLFAMGMATALLLSIACSKASAPPSLEEQAQSIDRGLFCPVCPSETIDQSQVPLAAEMRAFVREKLAEGWTRQQILDYFSSTERYGPSVLAEPPKSGTGLAVWLAPPIGVLAAATLLFFVLRAMRRRLPAFEAALPPDKELEPYLALVDEELAQRSQSQREHKPPSGGTESLATPDTARRTDG